MRCFPFKRILNYKAYSRRRRCGANLCNAPCCVGYFFACRPIWVSIIGRLLVYFTIEQDFLHLEGYLLLFARGGWLARSISAFARCRASANFHCLPFGRAFMVLVIRGTGMANAKYVRAVFRESVISGQLSVVHDLHSNERLAARCSLRAIVRRALQVARAMINAFSSHVDHVIIFCSRQRTNVLRISNRYVSLTKGCAIRYQSRVRSPASKASQVDRVRPNDRRYGNLFAPFVDAREDRLVLRFHVVKHVSLGNR